MMFWVWKSFLSPDVQSLLPFNRVVGDGSGSNLVPVVVCHGHGYSGLAAGDEAYGIVVIAGVYFSVLLAADGLVVFQADGDGFPLSLIHI